MNGYDPGQRARVTRADLVAGLRELGVPAGAILQVHSSLTRLGYVEGGAETVVDALLEVVGPEGTVMVPTFNFGRPGVGDLYDPKVTPSLVGAITEALRLRPEARRSLHPTHPYAAIGPQAEELVSGHLEVTTFDRRSPLGKLADIGGLVLLLGIGMEANTAAHIGETMAHVPCIGFNQFPRRVRLPEGRIIPAWSVVWRDGPCLIEWDALESTMRNRGMIRDQRIGDGMAMLMKALDVVETTFELTGELCPRCPTRPNWATLAESPPAPRIVGLGD